MPPPFTMPRRPTMGLDPAALVPRGSTGPMGPPQIPGNTSGMLIPGTRPGSAIWAPGQPVPGQVPEAQVDAVLPPQRPQFGPMGAVPMMPRGMPSLNDRATANDGAVRTGPLSTRGAVPVGRGMTPQRRLEMFARRAWTRGDEGAALGITGQMAQMDQRQQMQQQGMDFAAEQNETNFQQGLVMNDLGQRAQSARDAQQSQERFDMWNADKAAQAERDKQQWQNQLTLLGINQGADAMETERKRQEQEAERKRVPFVGTIPVPGTNYVMPTADGRVMGTVPTQQPDKPLPAGMQPTSAVRDGVQYQTPQEAKPVVPTVKEFKNAAGVSEYREYDAKSGGWRKVKFVDENNDGIDDRQQMGGGDQGSLSTRPAQPAGASNFKDHVTRLMGGGK